MAEDSGRKLLAPPVTAPMKMAFGLGSTAEAIVYTTTSSFLLLFYNQVLGLPADKVGLALSLGLIVNALFVQLGFSSPGAAVFGLFFAWTASIAGGTLFYRWIESPAASQRITAALGWLFGKGLELVRKVPGLTSLFARRT